MVSTQDRVRIIESKVLSDDWYVLKKPPLTFCGVMGNGSGRAVKLTTVVMEPPFCCSIASIRPWC